MDIQKIRDLIALMKESGVLELAVELPDYKVTIKRADAGEVPPAEPAQPEVAAQPEPEPPSDLVTVSAPMVGIFYLGGAGDDRLPLAVGDLVEQGQVVAAIESMKVPNDIPTPVAGRIEEILAPDASPVEFGQALIRIRPQQGEPS